MPQPILYSFRRCPYAMRARMAISVSGRVCRLREVVLRDKPSEMLAASPKGTVPVVVTPGGDVIEESLDVITWALTHNDPQNWLSPEQGSAEEMHALIAQCDGPFKHALDRYKYSGRYDGVDPAGQRDLGAQFLATLDNRLSTHPHLFGTRICLADIAIFPFIRQFANTDRDWFDTQHLPHIQAWLAAHLDSALFTSIMTKYPQWKTGDTEPEFPVPA